MFDNTSWTTFSFPDKVLLYFDTLFILSGFTLSIAKYTHVTA